MKTKIKHGVIDNQMFMKQRKRTHNVNNNASKSCICTNSIICIFCTSAIFLYLELTFLLGTYFAINYPRSMKNIAGMQIWLSLMTNDNGSIVLLEKFFHNAGLDG